MRATASLKIGSILPQTGSLAFLAPPEFAAAELAIDDINEAGGVLGDPVEFFPGDSGDTSTDTRQPDSRPPARRGRGRHHRRRLVVGVADRDRQDHRGRRHPVQPGQHLADAGRLPGQGPVLPQRPAGRPAGQRRCSARRRRRQQLGVHPRPRRRLRHQPRRRHRRGPRPPPASRCSAPRSTTRRPPASTPRSTRSSTAIRTRSS